MPRQKRYDLLNFLSEPRCLEEVCKYLGIPPSSVNRLLQNAIKQNQVLTFEHLKQWRQNSHTKQKQNLFYISRDSAAKLNELRGFASTRALRAQEEMGDTTHFVKFDSRNASKSSFSCNPQSISVVKEEGVANTEFPKVIGQRETLAKGKRRDITVFRMPIKDNRERSMSVAKRLSMLKTLSRRPMSYLDLKARFKIPKRTIRSFVKNGLLEEVWGVTNIGVRFRLTKKGKRHLERLRSLSKLRQDEIRKAAIQLKCNVP